MTKKTRTVLHDYVYKDYHIVVFDTGMVSVFAKSESNAKLNPRTNIILGAADIIPKDHLFLFGITNAAEYDIQPLLDLFDSFVKTVDMSVDQASNSGNDQLVLNVNNEEHIQFAQWVIQHNQWNDIQKWMILSGFLRHFPNITNFDDDTVELYQEIVDNQDVTAATVVNNRESLQTFASRILPTYPYDLPVLRVKTVEDFRSMIALVRFVSGDIDEYTSKDSKSFRHVSNSDVFVQNNVSDDHFMSPHRVVTYCLFKKGANKIFADRETFTKFWGYHSAFSASKKKIGKDVSFVPEAMREDDERKESLYFLTDKEYVLFVDAVLDSCRIVDMDKNSVFNLSRYVTMLAALFVNECEFEVDGLRDIILSVDEFVKSMKVSRGSKHLWVAYHDQSSKYNDMVSNPDFFKALQESARTGIPFSLISSMYGIGDTND